MPSRNKKKMSTDARGGKPAHPEKAKFLLAVDEYALGQHPRQKGLSGGSVHAAALLCCWLAFQFHGSRSATLLAG
jgi:hypothetical protein